MYNQYCLNQYKKKIIKTNKPFDSFNTDPDELLGLLGCTRGQILQQIKQQLLSLINHLGALDNKPLQGQEASEDRGHQAGLVYCLDPERNTKFLKY